VDEDTATTEIIGQDLPADENPQPEPPTEEQAIAAAAWAPGVAEPEPEPEPAPATEPATEPARKQRGLLVTLVVPLLAALIGALVGGGIVAATQNDDKPASTTSSFGRNGSVIAKPQDIQQILERVQPGVVSIKTQAFQLGVFGDAIPQSGAGTGMIVSDDGKVLTNAHVVRGATTIKVTLFNEKDARDADLLGIDPAADVAVVKIRDASNLPTVKFGSSKDLRVGDDVLAIGNALALPGGPSVTEGIVSAKDRSIGTGDEQLESLIQTDAAINPGNSGGPLVNANGEVVGMNTAVIQSAGAALAQNIGFAIAVDTIKPLLTKLENGKGGVVSGQTFLGVSSTTVTPEIKQRFDLPVDKGAIISEVVIGSPAESAGFQPGDVITKFGDKNITSAEDLVSAVRAAKPGDKVEVQYVRGQSKKSATVTLGSRARPAG
jgi:serine protease Do